MAKFKVGDVVRSLYHNPYSAQVAKGELVKIAEVDEDGAIRFFNMSPNKVFDYPWHGQACNFELTSPRSFTNK